MLEPVGLLVGLLLLAALVAFPAYVLVRLAQLGRSVKELKEGLALRPGREPQGAEPAAQRPPAPPARDVAELARRVAAPVPTPAAQGMAGAAPAPGTSPPRQAPPPPPPPPPAAPRPAPAQRDLESVLGANWLSKLGMAAIVVAVSFFLKYAFESGWIGPSARVAMGLVASALLLGSGQALLAKPRYRLHAQVLTSGGIVILFLSIYAAYALYHLIGFTVAFAVLAAGALTASAVAVANDTQAVALLCLLGAFATPVLIRQADTGSGQLLRLYAYLAGLNMWSGVLVRYRPWHSLSVLSLAATWVLFFGAGGLSGPRYLQGEAFAAVFLVFALYGGLRVSRTQAGALGEMAQPGAALVLVGVLAFTVASALILAGISSFGVPGLAAISMLVALLLAGLALAFPGAAAQNAAVRATFRYLSAAVLGLLVAVSVGTAQPVSRADAPAAFCFALFVYLLFLGIAVWMADREEGEGPALALVGANALAHAVAAFHVLAAVRIWGINAGPLWLPLAAWIAIGALWVAGAMPARRKLLLKAIALTAQALALVGFFGALGIGQRWPALRGVALFGAQFLLVSGSWVAVRRIVSWPELRVDVVAALGNAVVFFGLLAVAARMESYQGLVLLSGCAVAMAAYHAIVGGMVLRRPGDDALHRFVYLGLAITLVTIAIPLQLKAHYITLAWAVESAVLVWTGLAGRDWRVRWGGLILLCLAADKALFVDIARAPGTFHLFLNGRMLSGASVIAAAYLSAWLMWRNRDAVQIRERPAVPVLAMAANIFTIIFVSLDLWDYVGQTWPAAARGSAQQLALSLFWSVYALAGMCVGIWQRSRPARLSALALLCLAVTKVFLFDLSFLDVPYRIVSFLVLGLILLGVALLYTRFEGRLK